MGEIQRQTFKGSLYSYIGVAIGFVTTAILFPRLLSTAQIGVLSLLVAYSQLMSVVGNLGFPYTIIRFFPYFEDKERGHNGLLFIVLLVSIVGFLIASVCYIVVEHIFLLKDPGNELYLKYSWLVFPLAFFVIIFSQLDAYFRALGNAVSGSLIKDITQRLLIFGSVLLFGYITYISFDELVFLYVISLSSSSIFLLLLLQYKKELHLKPKFHFVKRKLKRLMVSFSLYSVISGLGSVVIQRIDTVMIGYFTDLSSIGVYTTTFFFGTIILIPSRALGRISSIVIADAFKTKNFDRIKSVYSKSSINQFLIGSVLLMGIWANIDNCFHILPKEYESGKYVILFIGLSNLVNLAIGVNSQIIYLSKYYRSVTYFLVFFCALIILSNYLLIPAFGISGAAFASFTSVLIYAASRVVYVYLKFKFQPFGLDHLKIVLVAAICLGLNHFLPVMNHFVLDIIVRSSVLGSVFFGLTLYLNISTELNGIYEEVITRVFRKGK